MMHQSIFSRSISAIPLTFTSRYFATNCGSPSATTLPGHLNVLVIKYILAVASGKGGVGKSTTSVNLAVGMHRLGWKVGLLDSDIYGPSIPKMMNLNYRAKVSQERKFIPLENYGIKCMSMGNLVGVDAPLIWRGPMVMGAISQLFGQVDWGRLDLLVIDLPPGTGDAQLSISQKIRLSGAVIVSTPQDIALIDARRAVNMFKTVNVPILGVVENMSQFVCPSCGTISHIFGHDGARLTAKEMNLPFLGEIPLDAAIRSTSDEGRPITLLQPDSPQARAYLNVCQQVKDALTDSMSSSPRIVVESG
eukprot:TRINITY_DN14720_c0_g1::TRINITY_DN14720_c0_g1_i1::g.21560::m.21560 TRINITY_DN14720_c0_g1::TRINITY_DN14720_c0_g1_i1::g.21560  ORF type:complete len:306 (-),score=1.76,sp/Q54F15/NUBPL_DICDI/58.78/7e-100,ParA/PF10609.4/4.9e-35,CbiA/PF01656.18/5.3e-15,Fer4_NifH/PF00142.13/0.0013,Fer4_NifH/PF00142.13/0.25,MipZ/PF09140.6/4.6e-07,AAA_31/PF13614.1/9.6e-06,AAA_31/PF13614.1/1.2e+03,ArsA_ATPase/PF02374.10/0.00081,ArsA_ATPase/PF02374.10/2e+03,ArsA_ATPase/PF02374.10/85,AAA_26/PF13500.1/67,AAA_26/PF13500.1/0.3